MDEPLRDWVQEQLSRHIGDGAPATWRPLRVEASHRRFFRVTATGAASWVAMSSPPGLENNDQFVTLAHLFREHGIGVPRLLAEDRTRGFFLLSDLGDCHFEDVYASRGPAPVLPAALDTLHRIQRISDACIPPYTRQRFQDELGIYIEWCLGALLDLEPPAALDDGFAALIDATQAQPACCVHRDFHCRNLLLTPAGEIGVVDFQDALMGPATYDLASLRRR